MRGWRWLALAVALAGCDSKNPSVTADGGGGDAAADARVTDGGVDAALDAQAGDARIDDARVDDAALADGQVDDAAMSDAIAADAGAGDGAPGDGALDDAAADDEGIDDDMTVDADVDAAPDMLPMRLCPDGTPPRPEGCNGLDDDCDGAIDEGFGLAERCEGVGRCGVGFTECDGMGGTRCSTNPGGSTDQSAEERCNAVDDDCDGTVDEGDFGAACYDGPDGTEGVGACRGGRTGCMDGRDGVCVGQVVPTPEACDGVDSDCDGTVDEGFEIVEACGMGVCRATSTPSSCLDGVATACAPGPRQGDDANCDGLDDDCDGAIDEDYAVVERCGVGRCGDASRPSACVDGVERPCQPAPAEAFDGRCDNIDEDCDGRVDEEFAAVGCGQGICAQDAQPSACIDGVARECVPGEPVDDDANCDGVDGDCDGLIDEGYVEVFECGIGACALAATPSACIDGVERPCRPGAPRADVSCDGVDDDCDGTADEAYQVTDSCGQGICRAASTPSACEDGVEVLCMPSAPEDDDADCDGDDEDCDGSADEGVAGMLGDEVALTATQQGAIQPDIARNGAVGGVVWSDNRDGGAGLYYQQLDANYQQLDANGAQVGAAVRLGLLGGNTSRPSIAPDGAGGFGVAWQNTRTGRAQIHFARIDAAGAITRADLRLVETNANAFGAQLAFNGAEFGLTWTDQRDEISHVWFQRLTAEGEPIGDARALTAGEQPASVPAIAAAPEGWAVAYNLDQGGDFDVFVQRVGANGLPLGAAQQISAGEGNANAPRIAAIDVGFVAVWYDTRHDNTEIFAARLDANGARVGDEVRITDDPRSSFLVDIVTAGDGLGVAWTDRRAGNDEVWFQHLAADATPFGDAQRVSNGRGFSFSPAVAWRGGIFEIAWYDARDGDEEEIYFARGPFGCAP